MVPVRPASRFIVVDRDKFQLKLYNRKPLSWHFRVMKKYPISIGAEGYTTPAGLYVIIAKAKNPEWQAPNSEWVAPENRGKIVPGGHPDNPIRSRFMRLTEDGIGIHGTLNEDSIGKRASHGCIRMRVVDVKELYSLVPKHSLVYID